MWDFFQKFIMVMNALDNRAAHSHANRMCLAADTPFTESGTAGYLGQITTKKGVTEWYDCHLKPTQRTFFLAVQFAICLQNLFIASFGQSICSTSCLEKMLIKK